MPRKIYVIISMILWILWNSGIFVLCYPYKIEGIRLELKSSIEINNIQKQSSPATHFNDNRESTNWKLQPNTKCYLNPNIIDFVSFFVFLFSYILFNCFYVFYYIWNCSVVIVSISSGIWIVGWWFLIILSCLSSEKNVRISYYSYK